MSVNLKGIPLDILTSSVSFCFLFLLNLPGEMLVGFSLLVFLQLSHVALLVSLGLVQVTLHREDKQSESP